MNTSLLASILILSKNHIQFLHEYGDKDFFQGSQTFYDGVLVEMGKKKAKRVTL